MARCSTRSIAVLTAAATLVLAAPGALRADLPTPLAYWNFDDQVEDQVGDSDGTLVGDAAFDDDVPTAIGAGKSLSLGGDATATDYVDLSAHITTFAGLAEGTLSAWFKTPGAGVDCVLAASDTADGSSELRMHVEGGTIRFDVREEAGAVFVGGDFRSSVTVNDDAWHHVAVTSAAGSRVTMYVDGVYMGIAEEPFFAAVGDIDTMSIGRNVDSGGAQWYFDGNIDDVAVWDTALSCEQVAALAAGAAPDSAAPDGECSLQCDGTQDLPFPVGYWNFDDQVEDQSGFGRHGTQVGGVFDADVPAAIGAGQSLALDSALSEYVDLSEHVDALAALTGGTISAWIKKPDLSVGVVLAVSNSTEGSVEGRFFVQDSGGIRYENRGGGSINTISNIESVADDTWHHVAISVGADGNGLYVDGNLITANDGTGFFADLPDLDSAAIGRNVDSGGGQWYFGGKIDEVVLFDEALDCGQIARIASGAPIPLPDPGDVTPPAAPADLTAVAEDGVVHLDWNDSTEDDFRDYSLYRAEVSGGPYALLADGLLMSAYDDTTVVNGTEYCYVVTAIDSSENANESENSVEACATPLEGLDVTPPGAPSGLIGAGLDSRVALDWNDSPEADVESYNVLRAETPGGPHELVGDAVADSEFIDTDVVNGTEYYYIVTALDTSANESDASGEIPVTPAEVVLPHPFAYWPLDEGSGQVAHDRSGNGHDGTLGATAEADPNDPVWRNSVVDAGGVERGPVPDFAGDVGAGEAPSWIDLTPHVGSFAALTEGSIAAWVKLPGDDVVDTVLAASDSSVGSSELRFFYEFGVGQPGIRYDIRSEGSPNLPQISSFPLDPTDDLWHHVAVTVDSTGLATVYVDGFLRSSGEESGFFAAVANLDTMSLGRNVDSGGSQWHLLGQMSDVAVWDEPLGAGAVYEIATGTPIVVDMPPAAPTGLVAAGGDAVIDLDWDDSIEDDFASYTVYRSLATGGPYDLLASEITDSEYSDASVDNDTTYFYVVTAVDLAGFESEPSDEASATPTAPGALMRPGDCTDDGLVDVSDPICLLSHLFLGDPEQLPCDDGRLGGPGNQALLNFNGDEAGVDVSDAIAQLTWQFLGTDAHVLGTGCVRIVGCPNDRCIDG